MSLKHILLFSLLLVASMGQLRAIDEEAAAMQAELVQRAERELREGILPFWLKNAPDREHGGFFGKVDADLKPEKSAPRGSLLTSRILWSFSKAYLRHRDPAYLEMAHWAYDDLLKRFWDEANGGLYWTVTAKGKPLDTSKQIYGQVFGVYALSEYYRATSDLAALERAKTLYRLVQQYAYDSKNGGYLEVFSADWKPERQEKSVVSPRAAKSQNTHLHVMEAYANLLAVWPDTELEQSLRGLLRTMLTRIYNNKTRHLRLFMSSDWSSSSDECSYGHDIEASWLMDEAAQVLHDATFITQARRIAVEIAETTLNEGIDLDGGVFNAGVGAAVTDTTKDWWPQAEAVVGFLNVYQISGDKRFLAAACKTWDFIEQHMIDRGAGEWFRTVSREGNPQDKSKIGLWKCPYHNSRACEEIIERLRGKNAPPELLSRDKAE